MSEEYKEWLEKAESEFDDAVFNLENSRQTPAAFFMQQSMEKALKALIIDEGRDPPYSHNLLELAEETELPEEKTEYFARLNNLYTGVRYPGEEVGEIKELEDIKNHVEEVLEWIRKQLN